MRIALFSETYLPSINGVVTHVKTLKDGLEAMGHQVLVVTADCKVRRHRVTEDGVLHCPAFKSTRFYGYSIAKPVSRTRYKFVKEFNPDVIHIHDEYGISLSGITIAKLLKKPLVYTLHTMYDQYLYYISPKLLMPFTQRLVHTYNKFIADKASAITGPSAKCGAYLSEIGIKSPVTVIPNAVELDMFEKTNSNSNPDIVSQIKERFNLGDKTVFCFVGRLGKEKSVDVLFEYLAAEITVNDNIIMMIVGDGPVADDLKKQADKLDISEFVRFTGSIPHDKLNTYYYCCKCYITASISDTNSISMKEAMASGLPVLHICDPLNAGQIVDEVNGYIYHDAKELAANIRKVRDMADDEYIALQQSTLKSVEEFSQNALAQRLLAVYNSVIK